MGGTNIWSILFPYFIIFGLFYLLLIVPQKQREKKVKEMLSAIKEGDAIVTIGGIYGRIIQIKDDEVFIQTGEDGMKMKITRWAIKNVEKPKEA